MITVKQTNDYFPNTIAKKMIMNLVSSYLLPCMPLHSPEAMFMDKVCLGLLNLFALTAYTLVRPCLPTVFTIFSMLPRPPIPIQMLLHHQSLPRKFLQPPCLELYVTFHQKYSFT